MSGLLDATANSFYMGFGPQVHGFMHGALPNMFTQPMGKAIDAYRQKRDEHSKYLQGLPTTTQVAGDVLGSVLSPDVAGDIGRFGGGLLMAGVAPYLAGRKIYSPKDVSDYMDKNLPKNNPTLQDYKKVYGEKFNEDNTLSDSIQKWAPLSDFDAMNFIERPVFADRVFKSFSFRRPTQDAQRMWDIRQELEARHSPNHPELMDLLGKVQETYLNDYIPKLLRLRRTPNLISNSFGTPLAFEAGTSLLEQGIKPRMESFQDRIEFDAGRTPPIWNVNIGSMDESFLNSLLAAGETPFKLGGKTLSMGEKIGLLYAYRKDMAKDLQPYFDTGLRNLKQTKSGFIRHLEKYGL